jgi:hypothetical protein
MMSYRLHRAPGFAARAFRSARTPDGRAGVTVPNGAAHSDPVDDKDTPRADSHNIRFTRMHDLVDLCGLRTYMSNT